MKIRRILGWMLLLNVLAFTGVGMAQSPHSKFQDIIDGIIDLLDKKLAENLELRVENHALREALGDSKADEVIASEMKKPLYHSGDVVDFYMDDKEIKGKIGTIFPDKVSVITETGVSSVAMTDLPGFEERRLGYDPSVLSAPIREGIDSLILKAEPSSDESPAINYPTGAITLGEIIVKESKRTDSSIYFGWAVPIINNSNRDSNDITVTVSARDKDDVQLESYLSTNNSVQMGRKVTATSDEIIDLALWNRIDHYVVTFKEH